jgi:peroxiredoxin
MKIITILALLLLICSVQVPDAEGADFQLTTYTKPERLPVWSVKDKSGEDVRLDDVRGNPFVAIIFRGHGCYRCVQQLGKLAKVESEFRRRGVRLIGITNEPVVQMKSAMEATPLPFPVLSDSKTKLADSLGSKDVDNWHGIILVDRTGKLRWSVTGNKPFDDFRAILSVVDELKLAQDALTVHQIKPRP